MGYPPSGGGGVSSFVIPTIAQDGEAPFSEVIVHNSNVLSYWSNSSTVGGGAVASNADCSLSVLKDSGLQSHFDFSAGLNDGAGTMNLTATGATSTSGIASIPGGVAYLFDGDADSLDFNATNTVSTIASIAMWIKFDNSGADTPMMCYSAGGATGNPKVQITTATGACALRWVNTGGEFDFATNYNFTSNLTHLVAVYDTVSSTVAYLYINGGLQDSVTNAGVALKNETNTHVRIGGWFNSSANDFKGLLGGIQLFSRALSVGEVLALYQNALWGKGSALINHAETGQWNIDFSKDFMLEWYYKMISGGQNVLYNFMVYDRASSSLGTNLTGVGIQLIGTGAGSGTVNLSVVTHTGSGSTSTSLSSTMVVNALARLKMEVISGTLKVYQNGSQIGSNITSNVPTSGTYDVHSAVWVGNTRGFGSGSLQVLNVDWRYKY